MAVGPHNWSINCSDQAGNIGISAFRKVVVVRAFRFNRTTTDFTTININNITNLTIENSVAGKINFTQAIDLGAGGDINRYVNISFNRIELNSTAIPALNKSAILYLYNLTFTNPRILRDGSVCLTTICKKLSYTKGTLKFNVTQFTVYSAEETPSAPAESVTISESKAEDVAGSGIEIIKKIIYSHFFTLIEADEEINININRKGLAVTKVAFEVNQELNDVSFSIIVVQNPSNSIDNAYQYFEIEFDKIFNINIISSSINFKVRKDSGYIKETIALNKYKSGWIQLPIRFVKEDSNYYYYESDIDGYSLFAITGEKPLIEEEIIEEEIGAGKIIEIKVPTIEKKIQIPREIFLVLLITFLLFSFILLLIQFHHGHEYVYKETYISKTFGKITGYSQREFGKLYVRKAKEIIQKKSKSSIKRKRNN
ncbi:MAG: PGF-pre-PGF domain-containing protein [Nanoarchaeota archaeon]|nr:PGF-pre-PGF domain-containing protein [Nanoarchaeota archaeon]